MQKGIQGLLTIGHHREETVKLMVESLEFLSKIGKKDYIDYKGVELPIKVK